jgi:hypothetical protein
MSDPFWSSWRNSKEAQTADEAEFARRYGTDERYRSEARKIADHFDMIDAQDVYDLLKAITPCIYNAEAGFIRRWQYGDYDKEERPTGRRLHQRARYKNRTDLTDHLRFTGRGETPKVIVRDQYPDGSVRPITRDPLKTIASYLPPWAADHGFPKDQMSVQFRSHDKTGLRSGGDDMKELNELTDLKRLCVLVAEFFYDGYEVRDWF